MTIVSIFFLTKIVFSLRRQSTNKMLRKIWKSNTGEKRPLMINTFFFFVTRHIQLDVDFCVAMISRTKHQKPLLATRHLSTTGLLVPFFVGSFLGVFVRSREAPENGNMRCFIVQWTIEIIKQLIERLLEEGVDRLNEKAEICFAPELDSCAI